MESIIQQAPDGVSIEHIQDLYKKHDGDVSKILAILWDIPDIKNTKYDEKQQKWNKIRDICNAYEEEMQKYMQAQRGQQYQR